MDLKQYAASQFIKVDDLAKGPKRKTIAHVEIGKFEKPVLTFTDRSRLSLNGTNCGTIINAFGSADSDDLIGKEIELYAGPISFQGGEKTIVLVRASRPPPTKSVKEDLEDEIPF